MTGDFMKKKNPWKFFIKTGAVFADKNEAPKLDRPQPTHKWISNKIRDQKPINWIDVSNPLNFACHFSVGGSLKTILCGEVRDNPLGTPPYQVGRR